MSLLLKVMKLLNDRDDITPREFFFPACVIAPFL